MNSNTTKEDGLQYGERGSAGEPSIASSRPRDAQRDYLAEQ